MSKSNCELWLILVCIIAITLLVAWLEHRRRWQPRCECQQATCVQPPDGGWRE